MTRASVTILVYDGSPEPSYRYCNEFDPITVQWMQVMAANVLGVTQNTVKDITGTNQSFQANTTCSSWAILAGTSTTAAHVNDFQMAAQSAAGAGSHSATLTAINEPAAATGTYTVTANIVNSSGLQITYSELGMVLSDGSGHSYLITHDIFSGLPVANNGTLSVTYAVVNS